MGLKMVRLKDGVRMCWDDGEVSSTVDLLGDDDQETLVRKLKRIVALVEGEQPQVPLDRLKLLAYEEAVAGLQGFPQPPKAAEPPQLGPEQAANGWELLGADDLQDAPGESG